MLTEQQMLPDRTGDRGEHHVDGKVFVLEGLGNGWNGGSLQRAGLDLPAELTELARVGADIGGVAQAAGAARITIQSRSEIRHRKHRSCRHAGWISAAAFRHRLQ